MLSEHIFFITERISDILKLEKEREVECSEDERIRKQRITNSIQELRKVMSRVVDYLGVVEQRSDEQQHDHDQFYLEVREIAHFSDDILNDVVNDTYEGNDTANVITNLVERIRNIHLKLPSGSTYNFNTGGNINLSGKQRIGPTIISMDHIESSRIKRVKRPKSYGHLPNSDLVGFNHEIQTLLNHLLQHDETRIVGIVGMGGSGKTTLAKHIYHHPQIRTHFNRKVWVCISQSWDRTSILNSIWRQATQNPEAAEMSYDQVLELLSQHLSLQSYLVILDDIWCIDAWYDIFPALPDYSGSKVVVTTRKKVVPQCIYPTVFTVEPKPLSDEESLELFRRRTFLPNENISHELQQLGAKMVKKCKGLPLAIIALAGILRMDKRQGSWERIIKKLAHSILNLKDASTLGVVKEVLGLSYYELPHHLKPCVLYLRVFPEDYEIKAKVLIKIWIAECLIKTEDDDEVSAAEDNIDEMVQRCIIEVVETNFKGQVNRFRIHDLIRQMFVDIDQKRGFLKDPLRLAPSITFYGDEQNNSSSMSESQSISNLERILDEETNSQVRSIILLNHIIYLEAKLQRLFEKFRLLRVLIIRDIRMYKRVMPEEIGNLIHLRYLELGGALLLVESIGNLENLQTLDLRNINFQSEEFNFNLCKLNELRHLYFPNMLYCEVNFELGRLKKLKTLWNVGGGEWMMSGMPVLSAHLQELRVCHLNSEEELEAVFRTPSITSNNLQTLEFYSDVEHEYKLHDMNVLIKCKSLQKFKIVGRIKVGIQVVFPPNLIQLTLRFTLLDKIEVMKIISRSCPCLKILTFGTLAYMGSEIACSTNSFLQLEKLILEYQHNLKAWIIETSAMPSLRHLTIKLLEDLELNTEGWTVISKIPELTYDGCEDTTFAEKLRLNRKDDQNPSQITNYYYKLGR